jgi:uncharacterized damage-inducible protein DinB
MSTELRQLLKHMSWADALVWTHAMDIGNTNGDPRITELLHHVHEVQHAYLQLFQDRALDIPDVSSFQSLASLMSWGRAGHADLEVFATDLDSDTLARQVRFPWAEQLVARFGDVHTADVRQGLLQLTSHSAYHRGQINTRIRELGGEPPLTDFVVWVWRGQPEATWPTAGHASQGAVD